jgi:hypothetical protein
MKGTNQLLLGAGLLAGVGAIVALVTGVTFGLFSGTANGNTNSFTAGTLTLTRTTNSSCTYGNPTLLPGDAITSCQLGVTYAGSSPGFAALDVKIEGPTNGSLFYGDNSHGLTFTVTDGEGTAKTFTVPTGAGYTGGDCAGGDTCWKAVDLLAASNSGSSPDANSTTFNGGDTATWTVQPSFPSSVGNSFGGDTFQGGSTTITLTAHAVQTRNNGALTGCTVGNECDQTAPGVSAPAWS